MGNADVREENFFTGELDPEEHHRILDRIDESLAFHRGTSTLADLNDQEPWAIPELPTLDRLVALSDWLKMSSSPLRPSMGVGGLRGIMLRFLNLPVRIFGFSEIEFNRRQRDFIGELITILSAVQAQNAALKTAVLSLENRLAVITTVDRKDQVVEGSKVSSQERISALLAQVDALKQEIEQISTRFAVDEETKST